MDPLSRFLSVERAPPPWKSKGQNYANGTLGLHQEILDFYEFMKPRKAEENMRRDVVSRVKDVITKLWPEAEVVVFGSFKTGLYLPTSDVDLVVYYKWDRLPLWTLGQALQANNIAEPSSIRQVDDKSPVPGIQLTDKKSEVKVDLRFNVYAGVKAADFVMENIQTYPCLRPLVLVLEHFLLQRDLNEEFTGGICSYCLILMVISFLQHRVKSGNSLEDNLGVLLIEFSDLYGNNFNYFNTGISVRDGGSYFSKQEMLNDMDEGFNTSLLCIEDPLIPGNFVGQSSYNFMHVKQSFIYAYNILSKAARYLNPMAPKSAPDSLLSRIVRVTKEVVEYRELVERKWGKPAAKKQEPQASSAHASPAAATTKKSQEK